MTPSSIIKRDVPEPHYELHFPRHVEYWTLDGRCLGASPIPTDP